MTLNDPAPRLHIYILLDRSGSMSVIADDVIGGFNALLAEQKTAGGDVVVTLVQFDGKNAREVIANAVPISDMIDLDRSSFMPRGATPLLDATGFVLGMASTRVTHRAAAGEPSEEILVVSITDGHENASREYTLDSVRQLIEAHQRAGWSFAFLGADLDVYGEAANLGYDVRSVQSWAPDSDGAAAAFDSLSKSTIALREKVRLQAQFDKGDFFEGDKPAEADRRRRRGER